MKKRFSWIILALVMVFTSIGPVSAAEVNPDMDGEWVFLSDEQVSAIVPNDSSIDANMTTDEDIPTPAAYPSVHGTVYSMAVSPIAYVVVDGQAGFAQFDSISRTYQFSTYYPNAGVTLSNSEAIQLMSRLAAVCEAQADEYLLVGWLLDVTFTFEAPTPQSFVWTASGTNIEPSESSTLRLTGYGTSVRGTCSYAFAYPQDIDVLTEKYDIEIGGMYYFKTQNGTALSMRVSGTCSING